MAIKLEYFSNKHQTFREWILNQIWILTPLRNYFYGTIDSKLSVIALQYAAMNKY